MVTGDYACTVIVINYWFVLNLCFLFNMIHSMLFAYGTAHIQVYNQTHLTRHALRNFEDNSHVGLVRHEEYTACERLLMS